MHLTAIFATTLVALLVLGAPLRAGNVDDCYQDRDPALRIDGCTGMIVSGILQGKDLAVIYTIRGAAYRIIGQYRRAIEDYDQALRLDPGDALAYSNRGVIYFKLGEYRRAIEDYDQALRLDPGDVLVYNNRGIAYAHLGEYRRAIEDYDQMLRLDPGNAIAYSNRTIALQNLSRSGEGRNGKAIGGEAAEITSTGTGFFVDSSGRLLTNAHVVENCSALTVGDGLPAKLLALDGNADLALLRAPMSPADTVARFAARPARLNADLTVVGFPLHGLLGGLNVTRGAVSSLSGVMGDDRYFQISAAVQPGNSGGPVVNEFGAVVGVVQSKLDALTVAVVTGDIPQNINFAIRAELAKLFLNQHSVDFEIEANQVRVEPWALADDAKRYTVLISCWNG